MKTLMSIVAFAALLAGGGVAAAQAADTTSGSRIRLAQMDSPGDGLDGSLASRQGNARPGQMGPSGPRKAKKRYRRQR